MSEDLQIEATSETPSLDQILQDLSGFGLEETEEPIVISSKGQTLRLKLSNIPTEEELRTLLAAEEYKGHTWIARVKVEILSRSISWINGVPITDRYNTYVTDPTSKEEKPIIAVLRDMMLSTWGQEVIGILWKIMMVHCQKIEDRLLESLPESSIMTEVEKRFLAQAMQEIAEAQRQTYEEAAQEALTSD
jgi:hypothetical protein